MCETRHMHCLSSGYLSTPSQLVGRCVSPWYHPPVVQSHSSPNTTPSPMTKPHTCGSSRPKSASHPTALQSSLLSSRFLYYPLPIGPKHSDPNTQRCPKPTSLHMCGRTPMITSTDLTRQELSQAVLTVRCQTHQAAV
jgi:hypothetical protein